MPTTSTGVSLTDFDDMEGVGIPVININASEPVDQVFNELYSGGVLPTVEEVVLNIMCSYHLPTSSVGIGWYGFRSIWSTHSSTISILCGPISSIKTITSR